MQVPWFRHHFLLRRWFDRVFLDMPDAAVRRVTGRGHWPPYSLRAFVGGAQGFDKAGSWFADELWRWQLLGQGSRVLDIGCGCGRIAYALATEPRLVSLRLEYSGMDVDRDCVDWCVSHISPRNGRFSFYHADCRNPSYNPEGAETAGGYVFPHAEGSFDLILATSVFTHLLAGELRHYLAEISRLLAPGGVAYTSFFLYQSADEAAAGMARHGIRFPCRRSRYSVNREDFPANAVAYEEAYVRELAAEFGLAVLEPAHYGVQDLVLLTRVSDGARRAELVAGWHELEDERWRWTERAFSARVWRPRAAGAMRVRFLFTVPEGLAPVRLAVWADGVAVGSAVFSSAGEQVYEGSFVVSSTGEMMLMEFVLDRVLGGTEEDGRELGVQVAFRPGPGAPERDLLPIVVTG